jgi:uncharacterized membrane protein YczE
MSLKNIAIRYGISTLGLIVVALGVAISIKSNLGIAPPSCPPTILNLKWTGISVGTFTWMMHLVLILLQLAILRKRFKLEYLMQIPAAFVFGYMCDAAIWLFDAFNPSTSYLMQLAYCLIGVLLTAVGIKLEVVGKGWILAGDQTVVVLADTLRKPFSTVKVLNDIVFVLATALFSWFAFGQLTGNGVTVVIREGTLILAIFVGICMRFTDPYVEKLFGPMVPGNE